MRDRHAFSRFPRADDRPGEPRGDCRRLVD